MAQATFRIWRGQHGEGDFVDYTIDIDDGMVVLDAVHAIQAAHAQDLAVRWNCKAGKCGSCSAEINGMPKLMCMTRLGDLDLNKPVTIEPMQAFPNTKDLVSDVSWNYEVKRKIKPFKPREPDHADGTWRMDQEDVETPAGISQVHRMLPVPGRVPCASRPPQTRRVHRPTIHGAHCCAGHASA